MTVTMAEVFQYYDIVIIKNVNKTNINLKFT